MMEIRCAQCGHVGPVKEIKPTAEGMALICGACGHPNVISASSAEPATAPEPQAPAVEAPPAALAPQALSLMAPPISDEQAARDGRSEREVWLTPQAMRRLVPEPGDGLRCRKCAHLIEPGEDHCSRCGLNVTESRRWAEGDAPWERAPRGSEVEFERATLLWQAAAERWDEESAAKFADYARDSGLHEMAIRHLRFRLVDHPQDTIALKHLKVLADALQSRYIVARAQEEVSAQAFSQGVGRLRGALVLATLCFWGGVFILFVGLFMDNCR